MDNQKGQKASRKTQKLGQYWLRSKLARLAMVGAAELTTKDTVLEVGPGKGFLTEALLAKAQRVVAVEKDRRLIDFLQQKFAREIKSGRLDLIHQDIRQFDPKTYHLKPKAYKLVANLPYYLTGKLLRQFLTASNQPDLMVLMLQKEVAERIVARRLPGKESLLSLSVKAYGQPEYLKTVTAKHFSPPPKVDSAILRIKNISRQRFPKQISERQFFTLLRRAFGQKRKMLKKTLGVSAALLQRCKIKETSRAEELNLGQWLCLIKNLKPE